MSINPQINLLRMSGYTVTEVPEGFMVEDYLITNGWIFKGEKKWKWEKGNLVAKMNVLTGKVKAEPLKYDLIYTVGKSESVHCKNSIYSVCKAMEKNLKLSGQYRLGTFKIVPKN